MTEKMKRLTIIFFALVASLALFSACEQEDPAAVSVEPSSVVLDSGDSFVEVAVTSTGVWSAEVLYSGPQDGWISVSSLFGPGSRTVRVSASANDGAVDAPSRQALVVFSTTGIGGTVKATLNVIQEAAEN